MVRCCTPGIPECVLRLRRRGYSSGRATPSRRQSCQFVCVQLGGPRRVFSSFFRPKLQPGNAERADHRSAIPSPSCDRRSPAEKNRLPAEHDASPQAPTRRCPGCHRKRLLSPHSECAVRQSGLPKIACEWPLRIVRVALHLTPAATPFYPEKGRASTARRDQSCFHTWKLTPQPS